MSAPSPFDIHDSLFDSLAVDWATGICVLHGRDVGDAPFEIVWSDIASIHMSRRFPWGPSTSILEMVDENPRSTRIELQSGDTLTVEARMRQIGYRSAIHQRYADLVVDALCDAKLVEIASSDAAATICAQEIASRRAMGDV